LTGGFQYIRGELFDPGGIRRFKRKKGTFGLAKKGGMSFLLRKGLQLCFGGKEAGRGWRVREKREEEFLEKSASRKGAKNPKLCTDMPGNAGRRKGNAQGKKCLPVVREPVR